MIHVDSYGTRHGIGVVGKLISLALGTYERRKRTLYAIWTSILVWVVTRVRAELKLIWIGSLTWLGRSCRSSSSAYVYPSTSWSSHKSIRIIILFNRIYYRNQEMNYLGTSSPGDLGAAWILCMLLLCFSKLKTKERHVFGWWMRSPRSLVGKVFPSFHGWANLACSR